MRVIFAVLLLAGVAWAQDAEPELPSPRAVGPGLYAIFDTSLGQIVVKLQETLAPKTVKNFVDLATAAKASADATGTRMVKKHFYDGMIFHRVVKGFMIQTGDVKGVGNSACGVGPIADEINNGLHFDKPGRLAMANLGRPKTASCQIFLTVGSSAAIDGKYTIFGLVSAGQDVVNKISEVPVVKDRPVAPVRLNKVTIERRDH